MSGIVKVGERVLVDKLKVADTFWPRLKGLLGKRGLAAGEGLLLRPCSQIHTFFMNFPIDVLYLDGQGRILAATRELSPGRIDPWVKGSKQVLELSAGVIADFNLSLGQILDIDENE